MKPLFKLLALKVNEISELFKLLDQNGIELMNYVNKNELKRDDIIDIFPSVDNEHKVIKFEFEDNIINGLIVFKTFANNNSTSRQRRFYIKIADGEITDYKGVQDDLVIDGISLKGLANSESDRINYMPEANLILDNTEKLISIQFSSNYSLTGVIIEHCTCIRQMIFSTNDFAYRIDIEALDKKINTLAEQSFNNNIQTLSLQDDFATIDEINTVLTENYVQKKDLPPTVDLSEYAKLTNLDEYRKKDDLLSYTDGTITKNVEFTKSGNQYTFTLYIKIPKQYL